MRVVPTNGPTPHMLLHTHMPFCIQIPWQVVLHSGFEWRSNFDLELGVSAFPSLLSVLPSVIERGAKHLTSIEVGCCAQTIAIVII